jgi:hypothetical protein
LPITRSGGGAIRAGSLIPDIGDIVSAKLRLVVSNVSKAHLRPIETRYYYSVRDRKHHSAKVSHSVTPAGAMRAAMTRILRDEFKKALVLDAFGFAIFVIVKNGRTVTVTGRLA